MKLLRAAVVAILLCASPAFAAEEPVCDGQIWVIRTSRILDSGSVDGFMQAVTEQIAWYRANGVTNNEIVAGPLYGEPIGGTDGGTDNLIVTVHTNPPGVRTDPLPYGDAAWEGFVELFRANSEIVEEMRFCGTLY